MSNLLRCLFRRNRTRTTTSRTRAMEPRREEMTSSPQDMHPSTNSNTASVATESQNASKRTIPLRLAYHFANGRVPEAIVVPSPCLPPSNIDIAAGSFDLHAPYSQTPSRFICTPSVWLGGTRDDCNSWDRSKPEDIHNDPPGSYYQWKMTFGILEMLVGFAIPEWFLVRRSEDGVALFVDDNISALLRDWVYRVEQTEERWPAEWVASIHSALKDVLELLGIRFGSLLIQSFKSAGLNDRAAHVATCTVCELTTAVYDTIMEVGARFFMPDTHRIFLGGLSTQSASSARDFASRGPDPVRTKGWCEFTDSIIKSLGLTVRGYASTVKPFSRGGEKAHKECTVWECRVNNIDTENYVNQHVHEGCLCSAIGPSLKDVKSILSLNQVPVILSQEDLAVRPGTDIPYIAISHVWADGLGSTTEKGLPRCQIERLLSKVDLLDADSPIAAFWIDALCVPHDRVLRKRAIALMAQTYRNATAVLVLDAGILACSSAAPLEERLLRVVTSGWMQRLWTLQEALLARKLYFAFSDCIVSADELCTISSRTNRTQEHLPHPLLTPLDREIHRLGSFLRAQHSDADVDPTASDKPRAPMTVAQISSSLQWRSTSRSEDETLAIAGLVDIDARELTNIDIPNERIKTLLLHAMHMPPDIIFYSLNKLDAPGFRWAPQTLMSRNSDSMSENKDTATCTPSGLLAQFIVMRLHTSQRWPSSRGSSTMLLQHSRRTFLGALMRWKPKQDDFNAILLTRAPHLTGNEGGATCALVRGFDTDPEDADGGRFVCEYVDRGTLTDITTSENISTALHIIDVEYSENVRVRVT